MFEFACPTVRASEAGKAGSAGPLSSGIVRGGVAVQGAAFKAVAFQGVPSRISPQVARSGHLRWKVSLQGSLGGCSSRTEPAGLVDKRLLLQVILCRSGPLPRWPRPTGHPIPSTAPLAERTRPVFAVATETAVSIRFRRRSLGPSRAGGPSSFPTGRSGYSASPRRRPQTSESRRRCA